MRYIVFDIETTTAIPSMSDRDLARLELALVGVYDSADDSYTSYIENELPSLWPRIEATEALVGFNSNTFDIPILNRYYPGNLAAVKSIDLLVAVQESLGRRIRLNTLAEATLGTGKIGDGLKAITWWQQGEVEKVREYCLEDVRLTKELFEYALEHGTLKYKDLSELKDMKIDTSGWLVSEGNGSVTKTLGL